MSTLPLQKDKVHHRQQGSSCREEFTSGDQWSWRSTGTRTSVSGASMQSWDSSPRIIVRCRARILRQMSVDVDLSQRVQIAQQRIFDRAPPEQPPKKKVRSEDQVEEQTSEAHSTSSSSLASIPQNPSSSSTTITTPMQVDESDQDLSKRQKTMPKTDMNWKGWTKLFSKTARRDKL